MTLDHGQRTVLDALGPDLSPEEWALKLGISADMVRRHMFGPPSKPWRLLNDRERYEAAQLPRLVLRYRYGLSDPEARRITAERGGYPEQATITRVRDGLVAAWLEAHDVATTTAEIAEVFRTEKRTIRRTMMRLVASGKAERLGTGRGTMWVTA